MVIRITQLEKYGKSWTNEPHDTMVYDFVQHPYQTIHEIAKYRDVTGARGSQSDFCGNSWKVFAFAVLHEPGDADRRDDFQLDFTGTIGHYELGAQSEEFLIYSFSSFKERAAIWLTKKNTKKTSSYWQKQVLSRSIRPMKMLRLNYLKQPNCSILPIPSQKSV